jgi:hypothetical protein
MDTNEMKQQVEELLGKLRQLVEIIEQVGVNPNLLAKSEQLRVVCISIRQLERKGIEVPDELRQIKTSLTAELSEVENADGIRSLLSSELAQVQSRLGVHRPNRRERPHDG